MGHDSSTITNGARRSCPYLSPHILHHSSVFVDALPSTPAGQLSGRVHIWGALRSTMDILYNVLSARDAPAPSTNGNDDENIGSATKSSPSLSGLISTLVPTLIIALVYFGIFIVLRTKFPRQYAPRTYLGTLRPQERTPAPPNTLFGWIPFMSRVSLSLHAHYTDSNRLR